MYSVILPVEVFPLTSKLSASIGKQEQTYSSDNKPATTFPFVSPSHSCHNTDVLMHGFIHRFWALSSPPLFTDVSLSICLWSGFIFEGKIHIYAGYVVPHQTQLNHFAGNLTYKLCAYFPPQLHSPKSQRPSRSHITYVRILCRFSHCLSLTFQERNLLEYKFTWNLIGPPYCLGQQQHCAHSQLFPCSAVRYLWISNMYYLPPFST